MRPLLNELAIASKLVEIYQTKKLPRYAAYFSQAGFTKEEMEREPNKLFELLIIAAYDRQPFTWWARGWEPIWGIGSIGESLPVVLRRLGLLRCDAVAVLDAAQVERLLREARFCGKRLDSYGGTNFARTFKEAAALTPVLHSRVVSARTAGQVLEIRRLIDSIHGFGQTIAAKIVMYTLRELGLGHVAPSNFALVVRPVIDEYHNSEMAKEIERLLGAGSVGRLFDVLCELGDPFAIDALYYVDRDEPGLRREVFG